MNTNLEQVKQAVLHLPNEESAKFAEWYETQKQKKTNDADSEKLKSYQIERYKKARKWLDEHGA